jgi:hypothetical protein
VVWKQNQLYHKLISYTHQNRKRAPGYMLWQPQVIKVISIWYEVDQATGLISY